MPEAHVNAGSSAQRGAKIRLLSGRVKYFWSLDRATTSSGSKLTSHLEEVDGALNANSMRLGDTDHKRDVDRSVRVNQHAVKPPAPRRRNEPSRAPPARQRGQSRGPTAAPSQYRNPMAAFLFIVPALKRCLWLDSFGFLSTRLLDLLEGTHRQPDFLGRSACYYEERAIGDPADLHLLHGDISHAAHLMRFDILERT